MRRGAYSVRLYASFLSDGEELIGQSAQLSVTAATIHIDGSLL